MNARRKPAPSWKSMEETLRNWHEQSLNDPEYMWMTPNFEDMADSVNVAMYCATLPHEVAPDNRWMSQQEGVSK